MKLLPLDSAWKRRFSAAVDVWADTCLMGEGPKWPQETLSWQYVPFFIIHFVSPHSDTIINLVFYYNMDRIGLLLSAPPNAHMMDICGKAEPVKNPEALPTSLISPCLLVRGTTPDSADSAGMNICWPWWTHRWTDAIYWEKKCGMTQVVVTSPVPVCRWQGQMSWGFVMLGVQLKDPPLDPSWIFIMCDCALKHLLVPKPMGYSTKALKIESFTCS